MSRYFEAPDAEDEPTLWERTEGDPIAALRRCELTEMGRTLWPRIVEAVTAS
jgi:hypothetical protein